MNNSTLVFDSNGYLQPSTTLDVDMDTVERYFVQAFPNSPHRKWLFDNYQRYTWRFEAEVFPYFEQWLDGSFVTKKQNPKDIDIVTFIDHRVYEMREYKWEKFIGSWVEDKGLDAYLSPVYPPEHPLYHRYLERKAYWNGVFSTDRNGIPKGFLKLIFEKTAE